MHKPQPLLSDPAPAAPSKQWSKLLS